MVTQSIDAVELTGDGSGMRYAFPITGQPASAVVYFELDPGATLATHTDSAEEILLVVEGEIEATVGTESGRLEEGGLAVVPANVPHGAHNPGEGVARVVGFFAAGTIVSHFEDPSFADGPLTLIDGKPVAAVELPSTLPV